MPDFTCENAISGLVGGMDEVGRGCLAGPVVTAVVVINQLLPQHLTAQIDDSKKLSSKKRQAVIAQLSQLKHIHVAYGCASVAEIDRLNILNATFLAMSRAVKRLAVVLDAVLVDGVHAPPNIQNVYPIKSGDRKSLSIAAASIYAKEMRDHLMRNLARIWPGYGWESNMGYGTQQHRHMIHSHGRTSYHRESFGNIAQYPLRRRGLCH